MITINGTYNYAHIMCDEVEENVRTQIETFLNCPVFKGSQIRVMADTHYGKGAVIGFTATMGDCVIPNVVGVDIGCGIEAYNMGQIEIKFEDLDRFIREKIPSGKNVRQHESPVLFNDDQLGAAGFTCSNEFARAVGNLCDQIYVDDAKITERTKRVFLSLGTLGGGNHFIEIDRDPAGNLWLLVHSGSRNFGLRVANMFQDRAKKLMSKFFIDQDERFKDLWFLPLDMGGNDYLAAMMIAQRYAVLNRHIMAKDILESLGINIGETEKIKTVHNYISLKDRIIRKGAISANNDEKVLIPINMRDGTIVGTGKSSKKWNHSAPHGAGRVLGRNQAKKTLSMEEYQKTMEGVWSSSVTPKTLDEAPMAYKDLDFILDAIGETVDVDFVMKPVYNFKAQD